MAAHPGLGLSMVPRKQPGCRVEHCNCNQGRQLASVWRFVENDKTGLEEGPQGLRELADRDWCRDDHVRCLQHGLINLFDLLFQ